MVKHSSKGNLIFKQKTPIVNENKNKTEAILCNGYYLKFERLGQKFPTDPDLIYTHFVETFFFLQ